MSSSECDLQNSHSDVGLSEVKFCKSHSDEDISQKGLSVLNLSSFLHPNFFYTVWSRIMHGFIFNFN